MVVAYVSVQIVAVMYWMAEQWHETMKSGRLKSVAGRNGRFMDYGWITAERKWSQKEGGHSSGVKVHEDVASLSELRSGYTLVQI